MKIMHVQLSGFNEELAYQENLLLKFHKKLGYDVTMVSSRMKISEDGSFSIVSAGVEFLTNGVKLIRLDWANFLPRSISKYFRIVRGLRKVLQSEKPDVVFVHGPQAVSNLDVVRYLKKQRKLGKDVKLVVDNHADIFNSARNGISKFSHKIFWRSVVWSVFKASSKFFAVNEAARNFLLGYYGIPSDVVTILPMGGDPDLIDFNKKAEIRNQVRSILGFDEEDLVLITGGKLDPAKRVFELLNSFRKIPEDRLRLVIFGSVHPSISEEFFRLVNTDNRVRYLGWLGLEEIYKHFVASDLGVFLGTQSILWNHCIFCGLPAIFKHWPGMTDFTFGGQFRPCILVNSVEEFEKTLESLLREPYSLELMKNDAEKVSKLLSFEEIAKQVIQF